MDFHYLNHSSVARSSHPSNFEMFISICGQFCSGIENIGNGKVLEIEIMMITENVHKPRNKSFNLLTCSERLIKKMSKNHFPKGKFQVLSQLTHISMVTNGTRNLWKQVPVIARNHAKTKRDREVSKFSEQWCDSGKGDNRTLIGRMRKVFFTHRKTEFAT